MAQPSVWQQPYGTGTVKLGGVTVDNPMRLEKTKALPSSGQPAAVSSPAAPIPTASSPMTRSGGQAALGGGGPSAADVAAQQQAQELAGLRNEIISRRERANSIFDALTGAVQALAQEKRGGLEQQYQQETGRALEDFTDKGDELQRVYAARGLADSSYRINAVDKASRDYQRSLQDLGSAREKGLSDVGSEASGSLARIGADRGAVNAQDLGEIGRKEDGTYDTNALRELRNQLDARIREAEVQQSQFGTAQGFRGRLDQIAPYNGIGDSLRSALATLIQSATPTVVKDRLASQLIANYAPSDSAAYQKFYEDQKKQTESPTNVA